MLYLMSHHNHGENQEGKKKQASDPDQVDVHDDDDDHDVQLEQVLHVQHLLNAKKSTALMEGFLKEHYDQTTEKVKEILV